MVPVKQDQNIVVQIAKIFKNINVSVPKLKKIAKAVCNRCSTSFQPVKTRPRWPCHDKQNTRYEISITIVDDTQIRKLNSRFLNRKTTTDCLSFDLSDDEKKSAVENRRMKIFELVVNGEMAVREAKSRGHSSEAELALYITHGLLHNLGFDDSTQTQARKMHDTEDEILQQLGYGLVYNKRK
jgi:probable rRNA maturation factor